MSVRVFFSSGVEEALPEPVQCTMWHLHSPLRLCENEMRGFPRSTLSVPALGAFSFYFRVRRFDSKLKVAVVSCTFDRVR